MNTHVKLPGLTRKRRARDWCAIGLLTTAVSLELLDAALGIGGIATGRELAAGNVIDIADVVAGAAAAWFVHG